MKQIPKQFSTDHANGLCTLDSRFTSEESADILGLCLGWYGQWAVADKDSCLTGWCCQAVDNNGNYVNL